MEGYEDNYNEVADDLDIGTYCYCDDDDNEAFCIIINTMDNDGKYKIIDFRENRDRVVVKSSLRRIYDEQIIEIAKGQYDEYNSNGNTLEEHQPLKIDYRELKEKRKKMKIEQKRQIMLEWEKRMNHTPFTDPENELVEFWLERKDEDNQPLPFIICGIISLFILFLCILIPLMWQELFEIILLLGYPSFVLICIMSLILSSLYKTEQVFVFDNREKKIFYRTRYYILRGCPLTKIYGCFEEFEDVELEIKSMKSNDGKEHKIYNVLWKFRNKDIKIQTSKRKSERVVNEIQDFLNMD